MLPADNKYPEEVIIAMQRRIGLEGKFHHFVRMAWDEVVPGDIFIDNWHIGLICEHLEAVSRNQIKNLGINIPPACMKSLLVQVFWEAWEWIHRPYTRFISASFDQALTNRDAHKTLTLVGSKWFQDRWGDRVKVNIDDAVSDYYVKAPNGVGEFINAGWRFSTSIGGKLTGRHGDIAIIDDPTKPQTVSEVTLAEAIRWYTQTLPTRFANPKTRRKVIIMQRLHENDLAGYIQANAIEDEEWQWLRLPMRFEAKACSYTKLGRDPRMQEGDLLWPDRFGEKEVKALEKELTARPTAAQLQQRPSPESGAIFQREWFKHWTALPARFDFMVQSWDCAFKDTDGSDYVVGQVWGMKSGEFFLIDQFRDRVGFQQTCKEIERMRRKHPRATTILIEDKANGTAVIEVLQKKLPGVIAVNPEGGKEARAHAVGPFHEAGNVYDPDPEVYDWVDEMREEMIVFPMGKHDDSVDARTQALIYLYQKSSNYAEAMKNADSFVL